MKKLKSVFMLAVAVLMLAACSSSQLKTQTDGLKGSLPYKIGDVANVSSMDVADGVLTVEVTVSENNGKVSDLKADSKDLANCFAQLLFGSKGSFKDLAPYIKNENASVKIKFVGSSSKESFEGTLSAAEAAKLSEAPSAEQELRNKIALANMTCPYPINDDVRLQKRKVDGDNVVFTLSINHAKYDGKLDQKELKKFFTSIFTDNEGEMAATVAAAGKGAKWVYEDADDNSKSKTYTFTPDEVKAIAAAAQNE